MGSIDLIIEFRYSQSGIEQIELDEFYFELLENASLNWDKQNPKRVAVESYVKLLEHEGRLHNEREWFLCSQPIKEDVSHIRA